MVDERQLATAPSAAARVPWAAEPEVAETYAPCESPQMRVLAVSLARVAASDVPVLIEGETGSGKTTLARQVYERSRRCSLPLLVCHGATMAPEVVDALAQHAAQAVLIEEVGELAPGAQDALVRLLTDQERRAGPRFITTTTGNLTELATRRRVRVDLLYRLDVIRLAIPPLRHRPDDVLALAEYFLAAAARRFGRAVCELSPEARARLLQHEWAGNVRELRNCMIEAVLRCSQTRLQAADLHLRSPSAGADPETEFVAALLRLHAVHPEAFHVYTQRLILQWALQVSGGNRVRAAAILGMGRGALRAKLRRCGLDQRGEAG